MCSRLLLLCSNVSTTPVFFFFFFKEGIFFPFLEFLLIFSVYFKGRKIRGMLHLLVHTPNACNSPGPARLRPRVAHSTWNLTGGRNTTCCLPGCASEEAEQETGLKPSNWNREESVPSNIFKKIFLFERQSHEASTMAQQVKLCLQWQLSPTGASSSPGRPTSNRASR